jgi:hypothetical protein
MRLNREDERINKYKLARQSQKGNVLHRPPGRLRISPKIVRAWKQTGAELPSAGRGDEKGAPHVRCTVES